VLFLAACSEANDPPPSLSDVNALNAELQRIEETFDTPLFASFDGMTDDMSPPGSPAPMLLRATSPFARMSQANAPSAAAATALRELGRTLGGPQAGPIIPDALYGTAYEWDEVELEYVLSATEIGPANGVRFLLYAVNPFSGYPSVPLTVVGYVDLMDESTSETSLALHVVVASSADVVHLDYTVTIDATSVEFEATCSGYVSNGLVGAALRRLDFDVAFSLVDGGTTADASADAAFSLNGSGVTLEIHDDVSFAANTVTFARDFRFQRSGEEIAIQGDVAIDFDLSTITGQVAVLVNNAVYVSITFSGTANPSMNRELSASEQAVVLRLLDATDNVWSAIENFFDPAVLFTT
jgi:hypothetical protein